MEIQALDGDQLNSLMLAVAGLGILLLIGLGIRAIFPPLRKMFIPVSLLGGAVGLLLGPDILGFVPDEINATWAAIPGLLITVVFAPVLMGEEFPGVKTAVKRAGPHIFYGYFSFALLVGIPALITALLLTPVFGTNPQFSTVFETGWAGGHGIPSGMEDIYEDVGWVEGVAVGNTSATIGLLLAIFGGMILLNRAARKRQLNTSTGIERADNPDLLPEGAEEVDSTSRIRRGSLENLAFHAALIGVAIVFGLAMQWVFNQFMTGMPLFPLAILGGLAINSILIRTPAFRLIDKATLNQISGVALDFLIVSAIASLSLTVIAENWQALLIVSVVMGIVSVWVFLYVGPRIFQVNWVENSLLNFGTYTGVLSAGMMLLRAADPNQTSGALRGFALRSPFASPFIGGGLLTSLLPVVVSNFGNLTVGIGSIVLAVVLVILVMAIGMWRKPSATAQTVSE